jgi:rubredoxin
MSQGGGRPGQVLGMSVSLVSVAPEREDDVVRALSEIGAADIPNSELWTDEVFPIEVLVTTLAEEAERAYDVLNAAGGSVAIARVWIDAPDARTTSVICPSCGSERTQPFTHAGPAARVNRKCTDCGWLFKARIPHA